MDRRKKGFKRIFNRLLPHIIGELWELLDEESKRFWTRKWIIRRPALGATNLLFNKLQTEDPKEFRALLRINVERFETLLENITPLIQKADTVMREAIPAKVKLKIALTYLATGLSYQYLQAFYRTSRAAISLFIPEVMDAIIGYLELYIKIYASVGSICLYYSSGYMVGVQSVILPSLRNSSLQLTTEEESWLPSIAALMLFPSQFLCGLMTHRFGRKYIFIASLIPHILGFCLLYVARNYITFFLAYMFSGLIGGGCAIGPMFVAEVCSPKYRGIVLNVKTLATTVGLATAHLLSNFVDWRTHVLSGIIPNVIGLITSSTTPESPSWFAYQCRFEECKRAFYWLRGNGDADELNELIKSQDKRLKSKKSKTRGKHQQVHLLKLLTEKSFLKAVTINISISILIDCLGGALFVTYIFDIINSIMGNLNNVFYIILVSDLINVVGQVLSCFFVSRFKRRSLLFGLCIPCLILLLIISALSYLTTNDMISISFSWITLTLLGLYSFFIQIGLAPTLLTILGEIYPLAYRGVGVSVSSIVFVGLTFVVIKITPSLLNVFGFHGTLLLNIIFMSLSLLHLYFFLPETDKRTLQDIENELKCAGNEDDLTSDVNEQMLVNNC